MKNNFQFLLIVLVTLSTSCIKEKKKETKKNVIPTDLTLEDKTISIEDSILNLALTAHGTSALNRHTFQFKFRGKEYQINKNSKGYAYQVNVKTDTTDYIDYLKNGAYSRLSKGVDIQLSEKQKANSSSSLNSVIYFATLPDKLNDNAVIKKYIGKDSILNAEYLILEITFNEEGGGADFDDQFYYWINSATHQIDYLAYNYIVNKGGVRYRSAYNKRRVGGFLFQDYINYKAEVGTPLKNLPKLFENKKLEELSRIETEEVITK